MWGIILSEPLDIVALVSRYLNQLANVTHAHLLAINVSGKSDATSTSYAVLIRVSPGYSPLSGRLHTRYAPVRHFHEEQAPQSRSTCMY